jgi:radical SAM superfamily enzyme YgiQ (UPF0313 family)
VADIVLINPGFEVSFWGLEFAMPCFGKAANLPVACLPLLAALTPPEHTLTLMDENVAPLNYERLARADIVGVTGMIVQRFRMTAILRELKARGIFTVVGGPWVTVQENYFGDLADVVFVGEAESTWPKFLEEWRSGAHRTRYEQSQPTDMTQVPCPRYDLLPSHRYLIGSMQFSRGCPFQCEFCDIIVTFGRRPRLKTAPQVLRELDALHQNGLDLVFIVDDNLIGNKRAVKELLADVAAWQRARGYPLSFFTEASLDLAEDDELMRLMVEANIQCVFIGIETPNEESLRETKKLQNVRARGGTLLEKVRHIQHSGLEVWSGMIVGFDHDTSDIFDAQVRFLSEARIVHAMVGMLYAIPKTPLHSRLASEGRLDPADVPEYGTNVIPKKIGREALLDGYLTVLNDLYEPAAYFDRLNDLYLRQNIAYSPGRARWWRRHRWNQAKTQAANLGRAAVLFARLMRRVPDEILRREYRKSVAGLLRVRRDPGLLLLYVVKCAMHYHSYTLARRMATSESPVVNTL